MKIKVSATISYETEVHPDDYAGIEGANIKTDEDILEFEREEILGDSPLVENLFSDGALSDVRIDKVEEAPPVQEQAA